MGPRLGGGEPHVERLWRLAKQLVPFRITPGNDGVYHEELGAIWRPAQEHAATVDVLGVPAGGELSDDAGRDRHPAGALEVREELRERHSRSTVQGFDAGVSHQVMELRPAGKEAAFGDVMTPSRGQIQDREECT